MRPTGCKLCSIIFAACHSAHSGLVRALVELTGKLTGKLAKLTGELALVVVL